MRHPDPYRDCCGLYGTVETVETLRDCGDIMRLLETWHGVQSGSCRKAEFEWVGMVGVGLGRRTDIAQTVGVGRARLQTRLETRLERGGMSVMLNDVR